jgi:hypothetical protein
MWFAWLALIAGLASHGCRWGFEVAGDELPDGAPSDGGPPPVEPWAMLLGVDTVGTSVNDVVEDASGELWVVGDSGAFGPSYFDAWLARLHRNGDLQLLGVRALAASSTSAIAAASIDPQGLVVVGELSSTGVGQQPALGRIALDGTWAEAYELTGASTTGEYENLFAIARTSDGGHVVVGRTRAGSGGCALCLGVDALVAKLDATGTLEWARAYGTAVGDEVALAVLQLPDGDYIVTGGGVGTYDYGTADSAPSVLMRLSPAGDVRWSVWVRSPGERGVRLSDVVLDRSTDQLVIVGHVNHGFDAVIMRVDPATGVVVAAAKVFVDATKRGQLAAVTVLEDGDLVIAGIERSATLPERAVFVARLSGELVAQWSVGAFLAANADRAGLLRTRDGDLVTWVNGAGAAGNFALLVRMGVDGSVPACSSLSPATLQVTARATTTQAAPLITSTLGTTVTAASTRELEIASSPRPAARCSP